MKKSARIILFLTAVSAASATIFAQSFAEHTPRDDDRLHPGTKLYNGSVSAMTWTMGTAATPIRGYKYSYNGYGWLTSADYGEGSSLTSNKDRYTEKSTAFNRNGGITKLQRNGLRADGTYGKVDDLTLAYMGNRVTGVSDIAPAVTQNGSMDYPGGNTSKILAYNAFGALVSDPGRGITSVSYDNFGNPTKIQYSGSRSTANVYSAAGEKLKTVHVTGLATLNDVAALFDEGTYSVQADDMKIAGAGGQSTIEYHGPVIYRDSKVDMALFPGGYATVSGSTVTFHYYTQDYLGNNRAVINGSTGAIEQTVAYYPYGAVIADIGTAPTSGQPYKFGGKELVTANGLNEYDFGARNYYPAVPAFTSIDPLCEDTRHLSPYLYCGNNPANAFDPDGRSTWVTDLGDGTYKVVGGDLDDDDLNIYVFQKDESGKFLIKGKSIGKSATATSFYDSGEVIGEEGRWVLDAIIDPNDPSGVEFLSGLIKENPSLIDGYAVNAGNGGKYDFKAKRGNHYRGMPIHTAKDGTNIYASARDIGNIGAGYIAGSNGLPWMAARIGFDGYQSIVRKGPAIEGISSQEAQYLGWELGYFGTPPAKQAANLVRSHERAKSYIFIQLLKSLIGL